MDSKPTSVGGTLVWPRGSGGGGGIGAPGGQIRARIFGFLSFRKQHSGSGPPWPVPDGDQKKAFFIWVGADFAVPPIPVARARAA